MCHTEIQLSQPAPLNPPSRTNECHRLTEQPISSLTRFLHGDLLHGVGEGCHQSPRPAFLLCSGETQQRMCAITGMLSPGLTLRPLKKCLKWVISFDEKPFAVAEAPVICLEGTEKERKEQMFGFVPQRRGGISSTFDCLVLLLAPKAMMPWNCSSATSPHPSAKGCKERQAIANKAERGTKSCEINIPTLPMVLLLHALIRVNNRPKRP